MVDYKKVNEKITAAQIPYHTYTPESEKPVTSILKGLAPNITEEKVKNALIENQLKVIEVKQFIKKVVGERDKVLYVKLPVFAIKFDKETKICHIKNVRKLCWCKMSWHKSYNSKSVTQCYKCQSFGHIAKNCFRKKVCAICSLDHNTRNCRNLNVKKCANCDKNHQANDPACEFYEKFVNRKKDNNNKYEFRPASSWSRNSSSGKTTTNNQQEGELMNYSRATQGGNSFSGNNNQNNKPKSDGENGESCHSTLNDIKDILKELNFSKILNIVKKTVHNIKSCNDGISKITCFFEGLIEIFE